MKFKYPSLYSLFVWGVLTLVLLMAWPAGAQETTGRIQGVVTDETGGVMPGVTVEAQSPRGGVQVAVSNERGIYRFPALPPGEYELTATLPGFENVVISGVDVGLGRLLTIDIVLRVAGVAETVTVTGESPLIDTRQSASFADIDIELIDNLPKDRDFTSLVTIAPGSNAEEKVAGISIDGAAATENRYIVDGIDTTDLFEGKQGKSVVTDHLEEIQVKSSGYNAEFGGATGGVINVITKSGTNEFHGSALAYFVNDALTASPRQSLRLSPDDDRIAEYITYPEDGYSRIEPGFTLGGPILQDRLWFFASYIPQFTSTERAVTFTTGDVGTYEQTDRTHYLTANVSAQLSNALRARVSGTFNPRYIRGELPILEGTQDPSADFAALGEDRPNTAISGTLDYTPSDVVYVNVRGGYFSYDLKEFGKPNEIRYSMSGANGALFPEIPVELQRPSGWTNIPSNQQWSYNTLGRIQMHGDVTYYVEAAGNHAFKAGVQYDRPRNNLFEEQLQPNITIYWDRWLTTTYQERVRGTYGYWRGRQAAKMGDIHSNDIGIFVQDSWTIADKLTLNIGIRTEKQTVPSYTDTGFDIEFGFGQKISPRLGFAYDLNGKTKIYGSYGNFFDTMKLNLPRQLFGGEYSRSYYFSLDDYNWSTLGADGCVPHSTEPRVDNPGCPGTFLDYTDARYASNTADNNLLDPDIKPMESREFTLGADHELNPTTSLGVRYVHKEIVRTIEDVGRIIPGWGEQYYIANPGFGLAEYTAGPEYPAQPKATREYDGVEFRLRRRFSDNWAINTSYLYSKLWGNYAGLSNSDEIQTSEGGTRPQGEGRSSANTNRCFDNIVYSFKADGTPVFGRLATDRPHQFKVQGSYSFDFGTVVGLSAYVASGTPISRTASVRRVGIFYAGRMSDGRTPTYSNFDLHVAHQFALGRGNLELRLNVRNLFDQKTVTYVWPGETRDSIGVELDEFFAGINIQELIQEQNIRLDPRFLKDMFYHSPREIRIGFAYQF